MQEKEPGQYKCSGCGGCGVKGYPDTNTWMRVGPCGQQLTEAVCDICWGSGKEDEPWMNLRKEAEMRQSLFRLLRDIKEGCSLDAWNGAMVTRMINGWWVGRDPATGFLEGEE